MRTALAAAAALMLSLVATAATIRLAPAESTDERKPEPRSSAQPAIPKPKPTPAPKAAPRPAGPSVRQIARRIDRYQELTRHWQTVMGERRFAKPDRPGRSASRESRLRALKLWRRRAGAAWSRLRQPPHKDQWLCIHRYEGGWDDSGAPYYGGLQMDVGFQETYGSYLLRTKGTAENWLPLEQMWVAEKAYRTRGFTPWPNTARYCGLI